MPWTSFRARSILGFVVAPFVPLGLYAAATAYDLIINGKPQSFLPLLNLAIPIYLTTLLAGVPLYVRFERRRQVTLPVYVLGGSFLGVLAMALAILMITYASFSPGFPFNKPMWFVLISNLLIIAGFVWIPCGILGAVSGAVFWIIARPDLRQKAVTSNG